MTNPIKHYQEEEFVKKIVEVGIQAAKRDYKRPDQTAILKGSIAGFKACLGKNTIELASLLKEARKKSEKSYFENQDNPDKHWEIRGYALEIEWVCNVVSASLYNQGLPTIITPTARGMMTASKILGVNLNN